MQQVVLLVQRLEERRGLDGLGLAQCEQHLRLTADSASF
jgi:hypothetical protein